MGSMTYPLDQGSDEILRDVRSLYASTYYGDLIFQAAFLERQAKQLQEQAADLRARAKPLRSALERYEVGVAYKPTD